MGRCYDLLSKRKSVNKNSILYEVEHDSGIVDINIELEEMELCEEGGSSKKTK
ncbi:hypothetical protein S83_026115, partial [Arachis hypogaea]